jgi:AcrR family transcriptional regulator
MGAAVQVFFDKGYAASSVQDIATAVGVLKGSLYYYIDSKEDLLLWIVEDVHAQSKAILDEVRALDAPAIERLREYVERHLNWYLANLEEVTVFFRDSRYLTGDSQRTATSRRRAYERAIRNLITVAQEEGDVDAAIDPRSAAHFILSAVNHVPDWYRRGGGDPVSRVAATYADLTVGTLVGTRARPAVRRRRQATKAA